MTKNELTKKMLTYIETLDGDQYDEWYTTERKLAAGIFQEFAKHLNIELVVPEYVPTKTRNAAQEAIDRKKLYEVLLPEIERLFNLKYKEMKKENGCTHQD